MNYNNLALATNYIASSPAFKNIPFFMTNVVLPGWSINHHEYNGQFSTMMNAGGNIINYNVLSLDLLIDEDYIIYGELYDLLQKHINIEDGTFDDFTFEFFIELTNSKGNKVMKFDFYNCRIASVLDIVLDSQTQDTQITLSMDIVYDYYKKETYRKPPERYVDPDRLIPGPFIKPGGIENTLLFDLDLTSIEMGDPNVGVFWGDPEPYQVFNNADMIYRPDISFLETIKNILKEINNDGKTETEEEEKGNSPEETEGTEQTPNEESGSSESGGLGGNEGETESTIPSEEVESDENTIPGSETGETEGNSTTGSTAEESIGGQETSGESSDSESSRRDIFEAISGRELAGGINFWNGILSRSAISLDQESLQLLFGKIYKRLKDKDLTTDDLIRLILDIESEKIKEVLEIIKTIDKDKLKEFIKNIFYPEIDTEEAEEDEYKELTLHGFHCNGNGRFDSGYVFNGLAFDAMKPAQFRFTVCQTSIPEPFMPFVKNKNTLGENYLYFGISEGIGIKTTNNGRTGRTLAGIKLDGIKRTTSVVRPYTVEVPLEPTRLMTGICEFEFSWNPGYEFTEVEIRGPESYHVKYTVKNSIHDELFLFIQGKEENLQNSVSRVEGAFLKYVPEE